MTATVLYITQTEEVKYVLKPGNLTYLNRLELKICDLTFAFDLECAHHWQMYYCCSWHSNSEMVGHRRRLQRHGNGAAWAKS